MNFQKVTSSMKTTCGSINRTFRIPCIVLNSSQLSSHPSQIILSLCYTPPPSISAYNTTSHFRHLLIPQTHHLFQAVSQSYHPGVFCWSFREFPLVIFYKYYMHFEQQQQKDHMVHSFNDLPLYFIMHAQHLYVVNILLQYRFNGLVSH